jgi:tRNA wybutosine-synthesizing protein 1
MIDLIKQRKMTAFLVTNGAHPEMIKKLLNHEPTNLYITLAAPNKTIYKKECCPMIKNGWERLQESLSLLKEFKCNTVVRLTLSRLTNLKYPEQYAKIIEEASPKFVEVKGYMAVGGAREKMGMEAMPYHTEILNFAKEMEKHFSYEIMDQKPDSRVILLKKS